MLTHLLIACRIGEIYITYYVKTLSMAAKYFSGLGNYMGTMICKL